MDPYQKELRLIAPDSSDWGKWLDAFASLDPDRVRQAKALHQRFLDEGYLLFLSWHHWEELLGHENDRLVENRIRQLRSLPLLAWMRPPSAEAGLSSIVDVLAAEVVAALNGADNALDVRDRAKRQLLQMGSGEDAIGIHDWVWGVVRKELHERRTHAALVSAFSSFEMFDMAQTIGQISKFGLFGKSERSDRLGKIHEAALATSIEATKGGPINAAGLADAFIGRVLAGLGETTSSAGALVRSVLIAQGLEPEEIGENDRLADLQELAQFRSQLKLVASLTGRSFEAIKHVDRHILPSWLIPHALRKHGQRRAKRPGSDVNDGHLAVLSAYCERVYVDRRTYQDFHQTTAKDRRLEALTGIVAKSGDFTDLATCEDPLA